MRFPRGPVRLFGPVLFYESVRQARRERYVVLRTLFPLVLALMLWLVIRNAEKAAMQPHVVMTRMTIASATYWVPQQVAAKAGLSGPEMARVAETFFYAFMMAQFLAVLVFTPAYTAGAIAEDKDRHRLDFLLATDLSNQEIVFSKLISRVANLFLLVLAGLPVLCIMQVWGGIDPGMTLVGYLATLMTLTSVACLAIYQSVRAPRAREAIVTTYLFVGAYIGFTYLLRVLLLYPSAAGYVFIRWPVSIKGEAVIRALSAGNPLSGLTDIRDALAANVPLGSVLPGLIVRFCLFHGIVALACVWAAVHQLRKVALEGRTAKATERKERARWPRWMQIGTNPMWWKEISLEPGMTFTRAGRIVVVLIMLGSFIPAVWGIGAIVWNGQRGNLDAQISAAVNLWVRQVGTLVACLTILGVAVRAASSVSGERERETSESLLSTPIESEQILLAKWAGSMWSVRWGLVWLFLIWALGVATGGLYLFTIPWLVLCWLVYASFFGLVGLCFSVRMNRTLPATVWTIIATVGLAAGHCLPWSVVPLSTYDNPLGVLWLYGLTPPVAIAWFSFHGDHVMGYGAEGPGEALLGVIAGLFVWGLFGFFLWRQTWRRFCDDRCEHYEGQYKGVIVLSRQDPAALQ